ncbi:lanthionine synthetase LanC family protein [uncultured Kordia sp.]|uniref:lanthionine synthetase LanC family protein n=1 Tax=uncultured Kordia sp. TaxID=507699 RepID=UPI002633289F|nr:lanthionine synthetase LanC family protein [uncultured Kordia sp.]
MNSTTQTEIYNKAVSIADMVSTTTNFKTVEIVKNIQLLIKALEFTDQKKYLPTLYTLADKLIEYNDTINPKDYSLYQGQMETVYILIQVSKATNNNTYLNKALEITKGCDADFLHSPDITNGLYKGRAGTLLTLLHLYDARQLEWILENIIAYIERVIKDTIVTQEGAYWDHNNQTIKGSCDFAEGTAGIAFVFRELATYFNNEALNIISDWATDYINAQWNEQHLNWANYKKKITSKEELHYYINAYNNKELQVFSPNYNDYSWKHGSNGIITSAQNSSNSQLKANIATVAEKIQTVVTTHRSNDEFLEQISTLYYAGILLKKDSYKEKARSLFLDHIKNSNDEVSLGMLCFELSNDTIQSSLHCPILQNHSSEKSNLNLDTIQVKNLLLQRTFPKSLLFLTQTFPTEVTAFFNEKKNISNFTELLYSKYPSVASLEDVSLQMEVLLEKAQFEMFTPNRNNTLLWIQKIVMQQRFSKRYADAEEVVLNKKLILNTEDMNMVKISNMEELDFTNPNGHSLEAFISYGIDSFMLQMTDKGTIHRTSLQMIKLIYASFTQENTIQNIITLLVQFLSGQDVQVIYGVRKTLFIDDHIDFEVGLKKALTRITIDMAYNGILKPVDGKLWA